MSSFHAPTHLTPPLHLGNTLWLHPVSSFKYLKELGLNVIDDCVRYQLVADNFGVEYPAHIKELASNFGKSKLPVARQEDEEFIVEQESANLMESFYESGDDLKAASFAHLDKSCDQVKVYMSSCAALDRFWLQNEATFKQLSRLNSDIGKFVDRFEKMNTLVATVAETASSDSTNTELEAFAQRTSSFRNHLKVRSVELLLAQGKCLLCLARQKSDKAFNRAKIVAATGSSIQVFFLDYGDSEWVAIEDFLPLPSKFIRVLPFQAIECGLSGIAAAGDAGQVADELWDLTHDEDNFFYTLFASVVSQEETAQPGLAATRKYSVRLCKKNYPEATDIGHKLVAFKFATLIDPEKSLALGGTEETPPNSRLQPLKALAKQFIPIFIK